MVTISTPPAPPPLIGRIFHQPPELPISSPSSIHTPSSPSVSSATTTASPHLTKNQSRSTDTTPQSSKAIAYQMVSGAYPSIPTNHKPIPCSTNKHNETLSNGSMPAPSVQVSALSLRPQKEFFRHLAPSYTPSHSPLLTTVRQTDTTNAHHHTHSHHLRGDSRSQTTHQQLLQ